MAGLSSLGGAGGAASSSSAAARGRGGRNEAGDLATGGINIGAQGGFSTGQIVGIAALALGGILIWKKFFTG